MGKLHEVLAVENNLEKAAKKLIDESVRTMGKESLFKGQVRQLKMFNDSDANLETTEHQELTTTVKENLDYLIKPVSEYYDLLLTKEKGNEMAKADVRIGNAVLIPDAPVTFILGMEKRLEKLREVYNAIPTLAPGIKWIVDTQEREGVYIDSDNQVTIKTVSDKEYRIVAEATEYHAAQVAEVDIKKDIGKYIVSNQSGMMAPVDKAAMLERLDILLRAFKNARMRANNIDVKPQQVCKDIFSYINTGAW